MRTTNFSARESVRNGDRKKFGVASNNILFKVFFFLLNKMINFVYGQSHKILRSKNGIMSFIKDEQLILDFHNMDGTFRRKA